MKMKAMLNRVLALFAALVVAASVAAAAPADQMSERAAFEQLAKKVRKELVTLPWYGVRLFYDFDVHLRQYGHRNSLLPTYAPETKRRSDDEYNNSVRAELPFAGPSLWGHTTRMTLSASYQNTVARSNIEIFQYTRNLYSLSLSWAYPGFDELWGASLVTRGAVLLIAGGLIGFGARWAGGWRGALAVLVLAPLGGWAAVHFRDRLRLLLTEARAYLMLRGPGRLGSELRRRRGEVLAELQRLAAELEVARAQG